MKVTEVRFRKNVNLGNYENEHAEVCVQLEGDDSVQDAVSKAKSEVEKILGLDVDESQIAEAQRVLKAARRRGLA